MKRFVRLAAVLLLCLPLAPVVDARLTAEEPVKHYVCDPCGMPCDAKVYDHPGVCPVCGGALVPQEAARAATRKRAAILIFTGVQIIDYTGPYEVLGAADFDVYTVAATKDPITTVMGMTVVPKHTFADAPQPDVLVVPGGGVKAARESAATLQWIQDVTARDAHTMSVCNGAFILASAGLLDGLTATTTASNISRLRSEFPKVTVVDDRRFVDNGRIITTGGLTAGIDGALHVVARMLGDGVAQKVALGEEYDWRPRSAFARATLADLEIPDVDLDSLGTWHIVSTEGGTDRWEMVFRGTTPMSAADLIDLVSSEFTTKGHWTRVAAAAPGVAKSAAMGAA